MKIPAFLRVAALSGALIGAAFWGCQAPQNLETAPTPPQPLVPAVAPTKDTIYTSTREITAIELNDEGTAILVATRGGVLIFSFVTKKWAKWTRLDGLPSHEALGIDQEGIFPPVAHFPTADSELQGRHWVPYPRKTAPVTDKKDLASLDGLNIDGKIIPLPKESRGTHISALGGSPLTTKEMFDLAQTGNDDDGKISARTPLLVAIYGDGLWNFDGQKWSRFKPALPPNASEITVLGGRWVGTRREGLFQLENGKWTQILQPGEPYNHNAQFLAQFRGVLWMSTLEDGLQARTGRGWKHFEVPELSSNAPREMVEFKNALYVRHGGQTVDKWDGAQWMKNVFWALPRRNVAALAADEKRLFCAGWGGWSEWDGQNWAHHFDVPELQKLPILHLWPDEENLWIGTQSRGVALWERQTGKISWLDERVGLPDDWVTCLAKIGGKLYAGTFVGGLARLDGEKWRVWPELKGENVTALEADGQGGLWIGTRHGLWRLKGDTLEKQEVSWLDEEVQALKAEKGGLWIGTRTSLNFWRTQ